MDNQQIIDYRQHLVDMGVIHEMAKGDLKLGFEWAAMEPDQTDERVFQHLDRLNRLRGDNVPPHRILDLGCAHGIRLLRYAQTGIECIGVDILDTSATIQASNKALMEQNKPPITSINADIRTLEAADFASDKFAVINCSQVLHFMSKDDIIHMLRFIKGIAGPETLIAISLDTVEATSNSHFYTKHVKMLWDERLSILNRMGYKPNDKLEYRIYSETDMNIVIKMVGLQVHDTLANQSGLMTIFASTTGDALFDLRPKHKGTVVSLRDYLSLRS